MAAIKDQGVIDGIGTDDAGDTNPGKRGRTWVRFQKALRRCAARVSTRYAISSILVRASGGKGIAAATDGRILAVVPLKLHEGEDYSGLVSEGLGRDTRARGGLSAEIDTEAETALVCELNAAGRRTRILSDNDKLAVGTFPPFEDIMDKGAYVAWTFNPDNLDKIVSAIRDKADGDEGITVFIPAFGERQPIEIEHEGKKSGDTIEYTRPKAAVVVGAGFGAGAGLLMPCLDATCKADERFVRAIDMLRRGRAPKGGE